MAHLTFGGADAEGTLEWRAADEGAGGVVAESPMTAARVVIPVHNGAGTLGEQLEALARQVDAPEFDVVVVLNRCTDRSRDVAESWIPALDLSIVEADAKASTAYARNVGAAGSSSPYLLFCDADDRVGDRWVAEMLVPLVSGAADLVGGCPMVERADLPSWRYDRYYALIDGPQLIRRRSMLYALGASLGCSRVAFETVGGFDESFPAAGYEEIDLALRIVRAGWRVGLAPEATFRYRPRTTLRGELRRQHAYANGRAYLEWKEGSLSAAPGSWQAAKRAVRIAGGLMLRDREWRPSVYVMRIATEVFWIRAQRDVVRRYGVLPTGPPVVDDFVAPVATPIIGGLAFQARAGQVPHAPEWVEQRSLAMVGALLDEGGVFVDCGANIGVFTVAAALRVGSSGRVFAFEPDPRSRSLLEQNVQRHRISEHVVVVDAAVGAAPGRLPFTPYANDVVSSFVEAPAVFSPGAAMAPIDVEVVPLDTGVPNCVDFLKIDVEGYEIEVLQGARQLLDRNPDVVMLVELNPATLRSAGHDPAALLDQLPPERWALWLIDERADDPAMRIRVLDTATRALIDSADERWFGNVLAAPLHRRAEIDAILAGMGG
jgi:FkbM family methyltransferase